MIEFSEKHPDVHRKFLNGYLVMQKTNKVFSAFTLDQDDEQKNAFLKDGGIIGLTGNQQALNKLMVATLSSRYYKLAQHSG